MTRTQIQLPDSLYERAKQFAAASELSLAEITRRGIELYLERYPPPQLVRSGWKLPTASLGKSSIPLENLRDFLASEETRLPRL